VISPVLPTYARAELAFERGEGAYLFSTDGRRFLDFSSGVAVTSLGHAHPHLVAALQAQAATLWHCSNLYRVPGQERAAERLVAASFADTAFFCNSGAEAMECAIKIARKYHAATGHPERHRLICCTGSFHGRTLATLAAAGNQKYLDGFGPAAPGFDHVAYGNLNEMRAAIGPETAGIVVEPVQGEGGLATASAHYLEALRAICDEFGILLVFDEVQSGMGRTGKLFAYQWTRMAPDVMGLAKGIAGGFPVGACLATARAAQGMTPGTHGSTFGGNPLAMAATNAVLDVMLDPEFFPRAERVAAHLRRRLESIVAAHPGIFAEVRGKGFLVGVRCHVGNGDVVERLRREGMLVVAAGENVVRLLPPLIIEERHADEACDIIERVARQWTP
jgi:acetylornithine/N-succinyldiaminopimelate aminotransferase